ncbi:LpqN/LpqT family lipoprotein [Mycobacterium sp. THU-M104]|uniref:LpqN/LpqT family lipoprotein n=1 Tax=Mycobacterium sp. THU-M104 TaxID=3410515 RepID=UPI003B9CA0C3
MIQFAPTQRAFLGGMVAGLIAVGVVAGAKASADPFLPAPPPVPAVPAQVPVQSDVAAVPGGASGNRAVATPPASSALVPTSPAPAGAAAAPVASTPPAVTPATTGTLREYLQAKGVKLQAQKPRELKALDITLPVPARWTEVPDPNVPDAFAVIADRHGNSIYTSNAQVVVYKLVGNFEPREAIAHGYVDSQELPAWQATNASLADFDGFPSSVIEGVYRDGDMMLNTSRRHMIATSGRDKYLVSLSVTTDRAQAVADAPATDAIVNGFRVAVPGAPAQAPAQAPARAPAATPAGLPAATPGTAPATAPVGAPATSPLGLPGQTALSNQTLPQQPVPNLLALVPGLPPLPNLHLGPQH